MAQYLYVPFSLNNVPENYKDLIQEWTRIEPGVTVCYAGTEALKQVPPNTRISILVPGVPGQPSKVSGIETISTELLRHTPSLSRHLRVTSGNKTVLGPETANQMIADSLLDDFTGRLRIRLLFLDAQRPYAVARAFLNALKADNRHEKGTIRVEYFPAPIQRPNPYSVVKNHPLKSRLSLFK